MKSPILPILAAALLALAIVPRIWAEDEPSEGLSSLLNSLKDSVKDLDVGEGMKDLPKQFAQMKKNYAEQAAAFKQMQEEVEKLKAEVETLKNEVAALKAEKVVLKPVEQ